MSSDPIRYRRLRVGPRPAAGGPAPLEYTACREALAAGLAGPAPGRVYLLAGARQVGKTTLLAELARSLGRQVVSASAGTPSAALPGFWDWLWDRAEETAAARGRAVVLLDEAHLVPDWAPRLKAGWERFRKRRVPVHIVAAGALRMRLGAPRDMPGGPFQRLTLARWSASSIARAFGVGAEHAAELVVRSGAYPGVFGLRSGPARLSTYLADSIVEPALARDIPALERVRRPALLRQLFSVAASAPAEVVPLQTLQARIDGRAALETLAHYLTLLEEAFLVAALPKYRLDRRAPRRSAPPKLVTLDNALLGAVAPAPTLDADPARLSAWVQNACLAYAWNAGQRVAYWREGPHAVDAVIEGSWGRFAMDVRLGPLRASDLRALFELVRRAPHLTPLVVCDASERAVAERAGVAAVSWHEFLVAGPPRETGTGRPR